MNTEVKLADLTEIELFPLPGTQLEKIKTLNENAQKFRRSFVTSQEAFNTLANDINSRQDNLNQTRKELVSLKDDLLSSISVGQVYLKLSTDLASQGVSEIEILDCFKLLLEINNRYYRARYEDTKDKDQNYRMSTYLLARRNYQLNADIVDDCQTGTPNWFKGTLSQWKTYLNKITPFQYYLHPEINNFYKNKSMTIQSLEEFVGFTEEGSYPDWFIDLEDDELPDLDKISEELESDLQELKTVDLQMQNLDQQKNRNTELGHQEFGRSAAYLESFQRNRFNQTRDLPTLLCTLEALENYQIRTCSIEQIRNYDAKVIDNSIIEPEKYREMLIREFSERQAGFGSWELTALWMEKKLREARALTAVGQPLTQELADQLKAVFVEDTIDPKNLPPILDNLRSSDNDLFRILFYNIRVLARVINGENLNYLHELIDINVNQPATQTIRNIAEAVQEGTVGARIILTDSGSRVSEDLIKNSANFLRNHWKVLYSDLDRRLNYESTTPTSVSAVSEEQTVTIPSDLDEQLTEISSVESEVRQGNLADWKILFSEDGKFKEDELIEITGNNPSEREEDFERIIRENSIPCAGSPASVIRWFDSRVATSDEQEWLQWRIFINEEPYKKVRNGRRNRIIYRIDRDSNTIKFHVYFKKALHYKGL